MTAWYGVERWLVLPFVFSFVPSCLRGAFGRFGESLVRVDLVPGPAAEDFGFAPGDGLAEGFGMDERLEVGLRLPLAHDQIAALGLRVLVEMRLDVAGLGLHVVERRGEP